MCVVIVGSVLSEPRAEHYVNNISYGGREKLQKLHGSITGKRAGNVPLPRKGYANVSATSPGSFVYHNIGQYAQNYSSERER